MVKENPVNGLKQLAKKLTASSQNLLAAFLDDDFKAKQKHQEILKQIELAYQQQSFVVLQLTNGIEPNPTFETTYGYIKPHPNNPDLIILNEEQDGGIRMIQTKSIVKISFLNKKKSNLSEDQVVEEPAIRKIK
ncbi:hypothetical protein G7081_03135 [Vagococcus coleopterorum]|uniref:Uncharacterized protein n=2 Tax=Vagococcus coleopterorum TaxID=2714946 RepID=A0A6G8AM25_9ENTE|nr:hypothetical protein G7081_03135 [Vagococcus coleopterorum]